MTKVKKKKKLIKKIEDYQYGREIYLAVGYTGEDLDRYVEKKYNAPHERESTTAPGSINILENNLGGRIYFLRLDSFELNTENIALLVHELHHLVHLCLEDAGMPYKPDASEAYAYHIQRLFSDMYWHLSKYVRGSNKKRVTKKKNVRRHTKARANKRIKVLGKSK